MVTAIGWLALALSTPAIADDPGVDANAAVRGALGHGDYPWYDPEADDVRTIVPPRPPRGYRDDPNNRYWGLGRLSGNVLIYGLVALLIAVLIALVVWAYRRADLGWDAGVKAVTASGSASRVGALPTGLEVDSGDPLAEAVRLRSDGNYAAAIVYLFAFELLTLDRLRLVRLAPGKTGRQLVRSVPDPDVRGWVEPALRLFEAVYYGHRLPTAEAFEDAWGHAERLRRFAAEGGAS
ncbi:MAG TPA: DUF4129 domain-containing protein [Isosphaeraceae bacterium]|jgi:hypothetical protein|nr:DUF4129 domain-containing protein [Isosphaeraceae bacterium]